MKELLGALWRFLREVPLVMLASIGLAVSVITLYVADIFSRRRNLPSDTLPNTTSASVVIPNWNGKDLLLKYLPSVIEAMSTASGLGSNEIIVVDNGSTDGSAQFLHAHFPQVRVLALSENLGFGGGANAGFRAANNDIVVLLNSDMRVEPDFLSPLLDGFRDPQTFAVSCQIFFSDPGKLREETGLTEGWWQHGGIRVAHRTEPDIVDLFPCFYGGGGSCAFDRRKFLELGGFDPLYHPFYLEDADLGYLAWKRGWRVLYQPASVVYHEHRGTIGKKFSQHHINGVLRKNFILFAWKNIHNPKMLAEHFAFTWLGAMISWVFGTGGVDRPDFAGVFKAVRVLGPALRSRSKARSLAAISDREALRRPLGGYFRDEFSSLAARPDRLNVLFVSPYPICPPIHGGAVFMYQTVRELAKHTNLHMIVLLDYERERAPHAELDEICVSNHYLIRSDESNQPGSILPHAVCEFESHELAWLIHRYIYTHDIDVLQLEYTVLGQYAGEFRRSPSILFEHDVYFQSISRRLPYIRETRAYLQACWEYLRALRYELKLLPRMDRIQVCTRDNAEYLRSFLPHLNGRIDEGFRAGIDTTQYGFNRAGREPHTLLFVGSFRHTPNLEALEWFVKDVFPRIRSAEPRARLMVVGSDPPPAHKLPNADAIEWIGFVKDIRKSFSQYAVFVCPILSGSGIRVKLLEAFASGIPVVSTRIGAEGLAYEDGVLCALADDPIGFAERVVRLLQNPEEAEALAARARAEVVEKRDMRVMTERLVECYRAEVARMRENVS